MNITVSLGDVAAIVSAVGILLTAGIALATFRRAVAIEKQALSLKNQALITHDLVNSLSEQRLAAGKAKSFAEGTTEGRLQHLEDPQDKPK